MSLHQNVGKVVIPFATYAADPAPQRVHVADARNLIVCVNIGHNVGGSQSVVVTIEGFDPFSGQVFNILTSAALAAADTCTALRVGPGLPATANLSANHPMPLDVQVRAHLNNGTNIDFGVSAILSQ